MSWSHSYIVGESQCTMTTITPVSYRLSFSTYLTTKPLTKSMSSWEKQSCTSIEEGICMCKTQKGSENEMAVHGLVYRLTAGG